MGDHGERAICEMNVSYPFSCVGYLPPSFFGYDAALPYGHAICLDVVLHCAESAGTVVSNFGFKINRYKSQEI